MACEEEIFSVPLSYSIARCFGGDGEAVGGFPRVKIVRVGIVREVFRLRRVKELPSEYQTAEAEEEKKTIKKSLFVFVSCKDKVYG